MSNGGLPAHQIGGFRTTPKSSSSIVATLAASVGRGQPEGSRVSFKKSYARKTEAGGRSRASYSRQRLSSDTPALPNFAVHRFRPLPPGCGLQKLAAKPLPHGVGNRKPRKGPKAWSGWHTKASKQCVFNILLRPAATGEGVPSHPCQDNPEGPHIDCWAEASIAPHDFWGPIRCGLDSETPRTVRVTSNVSLIDIDWNDDADVGEPRVDMPPHCAGAPRCSHI